jgi:hypothetical protein
MSIPSKEIYDRVSFVINKTEGGYLTAEDFNGISWLAQLALMDWLSGDVSGIVPPEPYLSQKNRDWLSPFLKKYPASVTNGIINKPDDYYLYENMYKLNGTLASDCDEDEIEGKKIPNVSIELLSNSKFYHRCNTWIKDLQPSFDKVICKMVGNTIEFEPSDIGSVVLEYYRYPVKAEIASSEDPTTHDEVIASVVNFEWPEFARGILIWFICDQFFNHNEDTLRKQLNAASGKVPREQKA